jgi:hypothetical protein
MLNLLVIPIAGWLNRVRGGGLGGEYLPGHPRFWVAPAMAVLAAVRWQDGVLGILLGLCYLAWCLPPWGFLEGLGRWTPKGRPMDAFEAKLLSWCGGHAGPAFCLRHALGLIPLAIVFDFVTILGALAIWAIYEASWRFAEWLYGDGTLDPWTIGRAELATGLLWGALIAWGP